MTPKKFSLIPGNISRFLILTVIVLLATMGMMIQSAINAWLKEKSYRVVDVSHALHQRIDTQCYAIWQIYDNIAATLANATSGDLQETRLKQDVYYLEKPRRKTEALIFGFHDNSVLEMTQKMSDCLDILWGAETIPWLMYYLNGLGNSLILVSALSLKDLSSGFKEPAISSVVESRRAEMLLQANTLDKRETFSPLRHLAWQNAHYFTLRTTFNQPGRLVTVVTFDLPINDLIPPGMALDSFRTRPDPSQNLAVNPDKETTDHIGTTLNNMQIDIATDISTIGMQLLWTIPLSSMLLAALQDIPLPLLLNIGLLALALFGFTTFHHFKGRSSPPGIGFPPATNNEPRLLRAINEEIVSLLPLRLLVYDQEVSRTLISSPIADHLLPHLNLQSIISMADQHQGMVQAIVSSEQYEVHQYRSQVAPRTQILIIRDQDHEMLVNKKLKQAQRLYEKNQQGRAAFMQHIGSVLKQPALNLAAKAAALNSTENRTLAQHASELVKLIDDIQLTNLLEGGTWRTNQALFSVQELTDDVVPEVLPTVKHKGLRLLINNALPTGGQRYGSRETLRRILVLLTQYSITIMPIGKVTLDVCQGRSASDRLTFRIPDADSDISVNEIDNLHFPYPSKTQGDLYGKASALILWLCDRMTRKLGGQLTIKARESLGTRYTLHLKMPASGEAPEAGERLLDDVIVLLDVTSSEVRRIITRQLGSWGVSCITPDDRATSQAFDLYLTDNPSNLTASGLLLSDDEVGIHKIGPGQLRINSSINTAMQEAIPQLIEQQLAEEAVQPATSGSENDAELHVSDYYVLFADTVPDDVQGSCTEIEAGGFATLAQTTHYLKGTSATLNLVPGRQLCETPEHLIHGKDAQGIEKYISDIDAYVKSLLQEAALYMNTMNVIIADDHPIILFGVRRSFEQIGWVNVVDEFENSTTFINNLPKLDAHVLITDLSMSDDKYGDGITLIRYIRRYFPDLSIIVLTMNSNPVILSAVLNLDVGGIVLEQGAPTDLPKALVALQKGERLIPESVSRLLEKISASSYGGKRLSPKESGVLRLFTEGFLVTEIAKRLNRSTKVISSQKKSTMMKLGVENSITLLNYFSPISLSSTGKE